MVVRDPLYNENPVGVALQSRLHQMNKTLLTEGERGRPKSHVNEVCMKSLLAPLHVCIHGRVELAAGGGGWGGWRDVRFYE